jgi:hypothetical protein
MAEEKHQPLHESNAADETNIPKQNPTSVDDTPGNNNEVYANNWRNRMSRRGLIATLIIVVLIVLGLVMVAGFMMNNRYQRGLMDQPNFTVNSMMRNGHYGSGASYGQYVQTQASSGSVTTTVYNYQTGVVIAVNSDNIVIAGNGQQTTIKTNSSTQYIGGKKPVVNDTVSVVGTTTDNTITATQIGVVNQ